MADRIKGITVAINGDVTGLDKALKGVNKNIKTTQSSLKDVERLLKLDPTNTELLAQKQALLSRQVENTSEKLKELKHQKESVTADNAKYDEWTKKYAPLQAQITKTEKELSALEKTQKSLLDQGVAPDSEELLTVQQRAEETRKKLEGLNQQVTDTYEALGRPISTEEYERLTREVVDAEQAAKDAEKAYRDFSSGLEDLSDKCTAAAGKLKSVSDKANAVASSTKYISAAASGALVASVKTAADFETSISQLAATMGVAKEDVQELADFAKEMGSTTAFSAEEAAQALNTLALAGLNAREQMAALPSVLDLAAAGGLSLDSAASYVTASVKGFADSMENAGVYADLIAKGATMAATDVNDLGTALSSGAATASAYGQSVNGTTLALLRLAEQNVTGSEAATALNRAMADLYTPSSGAQKALSQLGVSVYDATGRARDFNTVVDELSSAMSGMTDAEKNITASTIFTTEGLRAFNEMTVSTTEKVNEFRRGLDDASGSASQQAGTQLDNLAGRMTLLKSATEGAAISIGEALIPYVDKLIGIVQTSVDWFNNLDESQQSIIVGLLLLMAAIAPVAAIIGIVSRGISNLLMLIPQIAPLISAVTTGLSGLFTSVSSFVAANPIALIVAAIVALVALIAIKGDEIQAILQALDDWLQGVFATDWTEIFGPVLGEVLNGFFANLKNVWDDVKQVLDGIIDFIRGVFTGDWERAWNGVVEIFSGIIGLLGDVVKAPINGIISIINAAISGLNMLISGLNNIKVDIPDWVPLLGGKSFDVNIPEIGEIPYLAHGGILSAGSAVVGEAGPELLTMAGGRAVVQPLTATLDSSGLTKALEGLGGSGDVTVNVRFDGSLAQLGRILQPHITAETARRGPSFSGR